MTNNDLQKLNQWAKGDGRITFYAIMRGLAWLVLIVFVALLVLALMLLNYKEK